MTTNLPEGSATTVAAGSTPPAPSGRDQALLQSLLDSGRLTVDQKLAVPIDGGRTVVILRVDLAPGVAEPRHTHPGLEILYGLEGTGFVEVDGQEPIPITPDTAVRVERGQAKALRNRSDGGPFSVLAVLILDQDQPALTTVD